MAEEQHQAVTAQDGGAAAAQGGVAVAGSQNIIITGEVGGDVTITLGGRDLRAEELAYLDGLAAQHRFWAEKYTPLAGVAETAAAAPDGPRLDLPLVFMPTGFEKLVEHGFGEARQIQRKPVTDLREAVQPGCRLVVLGEPGSGKTTTLWRLAYDYAAAAQSDPRAALPLLLPLAAYTGPEPALRHLQDGLRELAAGLAERLDAYLRAGRVILLLDGLNEMPRDDYRERAARLQALLDRYPAAAAVVTCRALDYAEALRLEKVEIKPLAPEHQRAYLQRYLGAEEGDRLFWQMAGADAAALWRTWQAAGGTWAQFWAAEAMPAAVFSQTTRVQGQLWARLRAGELPPLLALGGNPYLLVMLAQVYAAGRGQLPRNRGRLLAAFVDTLLAREARRCPADRWPGAEALRRGLSRLAYAMQRAGRRGALVDAAWAAEQIAGRADDPQPLYWAASATLLETSGGQVRFAHQLLQAYCAALAWREEIERGADLAVFWPEGWLVPSGWEEAAVLLAGLTPDMPGLLAALLPVHPALAARCIAESGEPQPEASVRAAQARLVEIVISRAEPAAARCAAGDALNAVGDPRPGAGLRPDGLPEIAWRTVRAAAGYRISQYPITNAQFQAFVLDGGYTERWQHCWTAAGWRWKGPRAGPGSYGGAFQLPNHPAVMVSWYEAAAFCCWLGEKLGLAVSLPTEAQWEWAAYGPPPQPAARPYPWPGELTPDHANYSATGLAATSPVGAFPLGAAAEAGVLDMAGNTWEWLRSVWREGAEAPAGAADDLEGEAPRVLRGGAFDDSAAALARTARSRNHPRARSRCRGFRIVAPV